MGQAFGNCPLPNFTLIKEERKENIQKGGEF